MKTSILTLKEKYIVGNINKQEYIKKALQKHLYLFDYIDIIKHTDVREIRITENGVQFRIGEEDIWLFAPPGDSRVAPIEIMNFDRYEPEETRVMDILTAGANEILDIGANIGWYSIRFAKRLPYSRVHAFEPMPNSFNYLQRNTAINGVAERVHLYNYGLAETNGSVEFYIAPNCSVNASLRNVAEAKDVQKVVGLVLSLDQWCANQQIRPDFIKCDVEGAELLVFKGGRNTLLKDKPIVFAEMLRKWAKQFLYHPNDMIHYFAELGYSCFAVEKKGARKIQNITEDTIETNYVFLHLEAHKKEIIKLEQMNCEEHYKI
jgi:FkbM family methyltransferase